MRWKYIIYVYGLSTLVGSSLTLCFVWFMAFFSQNAATVVMINLYNEMWIELVMMITGIPCMLWTAYDAYLYRRAMWYREVTGRHWVER